MLPAEHRLRRSAEFASVVRRGSRAGVTSVVLHEALRSDADPVRIGVVVGKSVGNAVVRNRVKRRLRHLLAERLDAVPAHASLVVRANPSAAEADSRRLGRDLDRCLTKLHRRGGTP